MHYRNFYLIIKGLVQSPCGKINVNMMLIFYPPPPSLNVTAFQHRFNTETLILLHMVAERVTLSTGDAPPGPDSAFNESGVRSPGSMAPDSAFNESGVWIPGSMAPDSAPGRT